MKCGRCPPWIVVSVGSPQEPDAGSKGVNEDSLRKRLLTRCGHGSRKPIRNGRAPRSHKRDEQREQPKSTRAVALRVGPLPEAGALEERS